MCTYVQMCGAVCPDVGGCMCVHICADVGVICMCTYMQMCFPDVRVEVRGQRSVSAIFLYHSSPFFKQAVSGNVELTG